jgi:hypothetical protein
MSFLLGKDWNVLAFTFERADLYRINGNRTKGRDASKIAENAKRHARTIYWAIFNQKGKLLDSGPGPYSGMVPAATLERLMREAPTNETVQGVLAQLQRGESDKAAKILSWGDDPEEKAPAAAAPAEAKPVREVKAPSAPAPKPAAASAAPAAASPTTNLYKLVVASDGGDEFESSLKLIDHQGSISGTLVAPDGEEVAINHAQLEGADLSFDFDLGAGDEAICLRFQGVILDDVVKGTLS